MTESRQAENETSAEWQKLLANGYGASRPMRRVMGRMFHGTRCKVCYSPLTGPGASMMGMMGRGPSSKSETLCKHCAEAHPIGTGEVDIAALVADVRGVNGWRARLGKRDLEGRLERFDKEAERILVAREAIIDRLDNAQIVAFFIAGFAGHDYPLPTIQAAEALVRAAGYGGIEQPWLPVGAAIHVGPASAGNVETNHGIDFTAMGPMVDAAWTLRDHAGPGEVVITEEIHDRLVSGYPDSEGYPTFDRRVADLSEGRPSIPVRVMRLAGTGLAP